MTEAAEKNIQISMNGNLATFSLSGTKVEVTPKGNVLIFTDTGITTKPAVEESASDQVSRPLSISSDFNAVSLYGARVEVTQDGEITVATNGKVSIRPAADALIGTKAEDGWVYAGISPDTGKPMYVMPEDIGGKVELAKAQKIAKELSKQKHMNIHVPSENELNVLFNNRSRIGGFNETGEYPSGIYASSTPKEEGSYSIVTQGFKYGSKSDGLKELGRSVRLVRS